MGSPGLRISDALKAVQRLHIEAAPLIYYVEENPIYIARMDAIIDWLENNPVEGISSVIILTEVLTHPIKTGNLLLVQRYRDILENSEDFRLSPINDLIANLAAQLRAHYNLRTPDVLHVATAIESKCDAFLTNDITLKRVNEIPILLLDELSLDPEAADDV